VNRQKKFQLRSYAKRLNSLIELVKLSTNRAKVSIVAHSMGGLVAREYIKEFGGDSINKLIMIGTPNHGVYGNIDSFCGATGAAVECKEMSSTSNFIASLNAASDTSKNIKIYTITGTGCNSISFGDGDGIVKSSSVPLDNGKNYEIKHNNKNSCQNLITQETMHSDLLNPKIYPEVLDYVKKILQE